MDFLFAKIAASHCWALTPPASPGSLGQPALMAASPMVRRKSPETRTKTRLTKRNSQSRQRFTRNPRWSRWKTWLLSAADLEQTRYKGYWTAQLFSKFCATSFDYAAGHVQ